MSHSVSGALHNASPVEDLFRGKTESEQERETAEIRELESKTGCPCMYVHALMQTCLVCLCILNLPEPLIHSDLPIVGEQMS